MPRTLLDDLRWLLPLPAFTDPLRNELLTYPIPTLDPPNQRHIPDGCRTAWTLPHGVYTPAPDRRYRQVTLGDVLSGNVDLCPDCLPQHLLHQRPVPTQRHHEWALVKATTRQARYLRDLESWLDGPIGTFTDVPWDATGFELQAGRTRPMWKATATLNRHVSRRVAALAGRLARHRPGWLQVRYAAEHPSAGLDHRMRTDVAAGRLPFRLSGDDRARIDRLVAQCEQTVASRPTRPLLVRIRTTRTVALRHRHLLRPVEQLPSDDGTAVLVLAVADRYAPYVGADQRFRSDWVDVHDGWVSDPSVRSRLRVAAALWTGRDGEPFGRLPAAYTAAGQLAG